jgi:anti-anti-sigma factor
MTDLPHQFGLAIVQVNGHSDIRVTGEVDLATAPELRRRLDAVIAAGTGNIDVDLSDVAFLDSSGLAVLLAAHQAACDEHRRLTVRHPSKPVLRVLQVSGTVSVLMDGGKPRTGSSGPTDP